MPIARALGAEAIGTCILLAAVVGSGIMAERLSGGNDALALLANAIATGAILFVLIAAFGPLSGAHFNPLVTLSIAARREMPAGAAAAFIAVQIVAALAGVVLAHAMFDAELLQQSVKSRTGAGQWISEATATAGLILTIFGTRDRPGTAAPAVALYITAAYWFTASTSFANPAVTIARSFTDSFAGIAPASVTPFIAAQIAGAIAGWLIAAWLFPAGHHPRR